MTDAAGTAGATVNRALVTVSVMMATTVVLTDQTIAAIALPHMQGGLSSNQDQIAWVMTTYFMAQAVTTACTGWIAGRIGRKRTYLIALVGFAACSMLSGSATSLPEILIYRAMQGMFSAPVIPISQALILDTYPRERHGTALAIWGVGVMFAPVISPVVGGWMTDSYGWAWISMFRCRSPPSPSASAGVSYPKPRPTRRGASIGSASPPWRWRWRRSS